MLTLAVLLAAGAVMELIDVGLRELGVGQQEADFISLMAVVLAAFRWIKRLPPDPASLAWASREPTKAAILAGVCIAVLLSAYFFATEEEAAEAAGASALGCVVAAVCAYMARRDYARQSSG